MKGFGDVLRGARVSAGFGLREASQLAGLACGELSKYENNKVGVDFDTVDRLADVYGFERATLAVECLRSRYPKVPSYKAKGKVRNGAH